MKKKSSSPHSWDAKIKTKSIYMVYWITAWVLSIFFLGAGPKFIWEFNMFFTVIAGFINVSLGIGMILAHIRYVKEWDELQRKMFTESAALTLGFAVVFAGNYQAWANIKLVSFEPQVWVVLGAIGLIHIVCTGLVTLKYR